MWTGRNITGHDDQIGRAHVRLGQHGIEARKDPMGVTQDCYTFSHATHYVTRAHIDMSVKGRAGQHAAEGSTLAAANSQPTILNRSSAGATGPEISPSQCARGDGKDVASVS